MRLQFNADLSEDKEFKKSILTMVKAIIDSEARGLVTEAVNKVMKNIESRIERNVEERSKRAIEKIEKITENDLKNVAITKINPGKIAESIYKEIKKEVSDKVMAGFLRDFK